MSLTGLLLPGIKKTDRAVTEKEFSCPPGMELYDLIVDWPIGTSLTPQTVKVCATKEFIEAAKRITEEVNLNRRTGR